MALQSNALCTVADVKNILNVQNRSIDEIIETHINHASDEIANFCNRTFQEQAFTDEIYNPTGTEQLLLTRPASGELMPLPVTVFTGITISATTIATNDFVVNKRAGIVQLIHHTFWGLPGDVKATWTGGYILRGGTVTPPARQLPADVKGAAMQLAAHLYRIMDKTLGPGVTSISAGGESITYSDTGLPKSIQQVLRKYKVANVS